MYKLRLDAGRRLAPALAALTVSVFLLAPAVTPQPASAKGMADSGALLVPPQELGSNWRQVNELDLPDDGIRLGLRDGQWVAPSPVGWATNRHCRKFASVLVFDPQLGLFLVARRNTEKPVMFEWELIAAGSDSPVDIPLRSSVRDGPAVASAPRFPLKEYAWRSKPVLDEQRRIARWSFTARTGDVTWAAYSWLLFDRTGYISILLLSRPTNEEAIWSDLDARSDPPILIQSLAGRPPLEREDTSGLDTYGTDFLTLFQLSDAVGCSLRASFGTSY